jgi:hypothetical protein
MRISQMLRGFDDLGDGFFAGEKGEEETIRGFRGRDLAE